MLLTRLPITIIILIMLSGLGLSGNTEARTLVCQGPYQNQRITQSMLRPILAAHQRWLQHHLKQPNAPGKANLCGTDLHALNLNHMDWRYANFAGADLSEATLQRANLSHANLYKSYFRWADLSNAHLQRADLEAAVLESADLQAANLRLARLMTANLSKANLSHADLQSANLTEAVLNDAILEHANLSWANLTRATLEYSQLAEANLSNTTLEASNLSHTALKNANFSRANLKQAIFQPILSSHPNLASLATTRYIRSIRFPDIEGTAAMLELRAAYKKLGIRSMERTLTTIIKMKQMKQAWHQGGWSRLESVFSYLFFYLPSDFGAAPGRALSGFLIFVALFTIPYYLSLLIHSRTFSIAAIWFPRRPFHTTKDRPPPYQLRKILKQQTQTKKTEQLREHYRLLRIALHFSLLSAFGIGWRELNVSSWMMRLQKRDYRLQGLGWIRVLAGTQSLLSAYLLVLWALSYFGRPFEW